MSERGLGAAFPGESQERACSGSEGPESKTQNLQSSELGGVWKKLLGTGHLPGDGTMGWGNLPPPQLPFLGSSLDTNAKVR